MVIARSSARPGEASRLLHRNARREEQGNSSVPHPSHRRPARHWRAGTTPRRRARDSWDFRTGRRRARDNTREHQRQHRRVKRSRDDRVVRVRQRGAQAVGLILLPAINPWKLSRSCWRRCQWRARSSLILELDMPFDGILRISSSPMRNALEHLRHSRTYHSAAAIRSARQFVLQLILEPASERIDCARKAPCHGSSGP
jgi:hypothetical protein